MDVFILYVILIFPILLVLALIYVNFLSWLILFFYPNLILSIDEY